MADKPHLRGQQPDTDEVMPRIEFDFADLGREEDQVLPIPSLNAVDVGFESLSTTLCPMKAFSENLVETIFWHSLNHLTQCGDAAGNAEQTSQANIDETWSESHTRVKARLKMRIE